VNKSIHQRLLEDFNPYNNNTTNYSTNYNNKNLDLITYPHGEMQQYKNSSQYPYTIENDLINNDLYNQLPLMLQGQQHTSRQTSRKTPKIIKIKIYTKKHKPKHKNHSDSRGHSSKSRKHSRTTTRSVSRSKRH
jgi:hypothetical protein